MFMHFEYNDRVFETPRERLNDLLPLGNSYNSPISDLTGRIHNRANWENYQHDWLPSDEDRTYVHSLMAKPVLEPGKFANFLASPARGINNQAVDFE